MVLCHPQRPVLGHAVRCSGNRGLHQYIVVASVILHVKRFFLYKHKPFDMQTDRGNKDVCMQASGSRAPQSKYSFLQQYFIAFVL